MSLTDFKDDKHPLASKFIKTLKKALGKKDSIAISQVLKAKRLAGTSVKPLECVLENGQVVTAYVCVAKGDDDKDKLELFRVDINDKQLPTVNAFSNDNAIFAKAVGEVAAAVFKGQARFDKKRAKDGTAIEKVAQTRTNKTAKDKLKVVQDELAKLNETIAQDESVKAELTAELAKLTEQLNG